MASLRANAPWLLAALIALVVVAAAWRSWAWVEAHSPTDAADAVAIYLPARALATGQDATDLTVLRRLLDQERGAGVRTGVLSTLYPPSVAVFVAPLTTQGWAAFLPRLRAIVLVGLLLGSAAAGWGAARGRWAPVGAAVGAAIAMIAHPLTTEALALGQANLLIAGLLGAACGAAALDRAGAVAGFAVLGAAVKLVPGIAVWPLVAARRWRGLAVGVAVGVVIVAVTAWHIPASRMVQNVLDTVRFQQGVVPAWVSPEENRWSTFLGLFRFGPLGVITLVITGVCAASAHRSAADRPAVLAACVALGTAWLGAAGAAVGVFYGLLLLPALISVAVWPLAPGAPRWAWALCPTAALPWLLVSAPHDAVWATLQMLLAGLLVWGIATVQVLYAARGGLTRPAVALMGAVTVGAVAWTLSISLFPPPPPSGPPPTHHQQGEHVGPPPPPPPPGRR